METAALRLSTCLYYPELDINDSVLHFCLVLLTDGQTEHLDRTTRSILIEFTVPTRVSNQLRGIRSGAGALPSVSFLGRLADIKFILQPS